MNTKEYFFTLKISLVMASRMLGLFMLFPVFSVYAQYYDKTTPLLIGVAIGIYGLTQALLQIPFGYLSDFYGRKPILIIGLITFFIGSIIAASTTDIVVVIIGRAIQGGGAISAVLMAFLADYVPLEQRAKANAIVGMQIGLAFILALIIGPIIAANLGVYAIFWITAALSIGAIFIVLTLPYAKPQAQYILSIANVKKVLTTNLLVLDFSIFTLHLILTSLFIVIPILLVEGAIVDIKNSWQIYLPVMVLAFIVMLPIMILTEKFNKTKITLLASIFIILVSQILFYIISNTSYTLLKLNYTTFFILLVLFFIAFNLIEATLPALITKIAGTDKRGLAMGMFSTHQFLGTFSGGFLGGLIYNIFNLNSVLLFTALITIIWLFIVFCAYNKTKN